MQADRCTVFIYDKEKDELWSKVALGMDSQEIRFPATKGLAGYVVKTGETLNIEDAYNDLRFNKDVDLKTGYKTKTILCMPIKNNNQEIIGAFQVLNKANGTFTKNDEDLLSSISADGFKDFYWEETDGGWYLNAIAVPEPAVFASVFGFLALALALGRRRAS